MKKGLIASFMVALMLITVLSAVVNANAVNVNEEIIKNKNSLNLNFGRFVYRYFLVGPIFNLTMDNNSYHFESENLWGLKIVRHWGPFGWDFERRIFHKKGNISMVFGGFKFFGIIKPDFICGCFHTTWW